MESLPRMGSMSNLNAAAGTSWEKGLRATAELDCGLWIAGCGLEECELGDCDVEWHAVRRRVAASNGVRVRRRRRGMGRLKMSLVVGAKFGIVVLLIVVLFGCAAREERFEFTRWEMGVKARVVVYAASREKAGSGAQAAFGRIAGLDACMSDYRPDSEVMKLCRGPELERVRVSEDLYRVLKAGARVSEVSGGAFDVTVGPEVALWREARKTGELPAEGVVALVAQRVGWRGVELEDVGPAVRLQTRNMLIDLGGIGKGYAAEEAVKELRRRGMARCLVALAGDICVGEAPSGEKGRGIEVAGSGRALTLRNACVST